jgi:hypothetical protein
MAQTTIQGGFLAADLVSAQTALTTGLATTDEIIVSDAGVIKRMDISVFEIAATQITASGTLPALNGSNLTALSAANITASGTLPALNGAALTALTAANITASGTLPALNGAALTALTAANITASGTLPALNGAALTALSAANITASGTLPALNGAALTALNGTQVTTGTLPAARIAADSIVEAKLDVSNGPTNGHYLQAQSGEGGGLTWAAVSAGGDFSNGGDNGALVLGTNDANSLTLETTNTARVVIASGGDVTVSTGNLVIGTHGKGIDFAANTQDEIGAGSISSEILDDYEEGTFTPSLTDSGGAARSHSVQFGHYTKIGNRVSFNLRVVANGDGSATGSSLSQIRGLPFVCDSTGNSETAFPVSYAVSLNIIAGGTLVGNSDANGNAHFYIRTWDTTDGTTDVTLNELTNNCWLNISGQYEVD